ncbi:hypothetical protein EV1_039955 [Malus domestica]
MSFNQSRSDKNETQYRKTGRTVSSNQQHRGYSPSYPKGTSAGWPGPTIFSNRSFKKNNNNAQGGQSRASATTVNTQDSGIAFAQRGGVQNRAHVQPQLHGGSDAPVARTASRTAEASASQRSSRTVPKAPTSQSASVISDTRTPTTPAKRKFTLWTMDFVVLNGGECWRIFTVSMITSNPYENESRTKSR